MSERPTTRFRPDLEPLERKQLLAAGASAAHLARSAIAAKAVQPTTGFLVYRITNPNVHNDSVTPPVGHVLVQSKQPVPGQTYNVLSITVRNGTAQTFDAGSGLTVRFPGQATPFPILTGSQTWGPGQRYVFYVLTKQYYPLPNEVTSGFIFDLGGATSTAIPGPSGIFLRLKYNPATINRVLNVIVDSGEGAQGGQGIEYGLPDTAIYEFVSAKTHRNDFGGYF